MKNVNINQFNFPTEKPSTILISDLGLDFKNFDFSYNTICDIAEQLFMQKYKDIITERVIKQIKYFTRNHQTSMYIDDLKINKQGNLEYIEGRFLKLNIQNNCFDLSKHTNISVLEWSEDNKYVHVSSPSNNWEVYYLFNNKGQLIWYKNSWGADPDFKKEYDLEIFSQFYEYDPKGEKVYTRFAGDKIYTNEEELINDYNNNKDSKSWQIRKFSGLLKNKVISDFHNITWESL